MTHWSYVVLVLSFFINSVQAWGAIATIRGALSQNQKLVLHLPIYASESFQG
jgi:hypothetical protein